LIAPAYIGGVLLFMQVFFEIFSPEQAGKRRSAAAPVLQRGKPMKNAASAGSWRGVSS
jgi:hypothetical protein